MKSTKRLVRYGEADKHHSVKFIESGAVFVQPT
jgi:hypothetical protein